MTSRRGAPADGVARQRGPRSRADPRTDSLPAERSRLRTDAAAAAVARLRVPRAQRLEVLIVEVPMTLRDQRAERGVERVGPGVVVRAKRPRGESQKSGDVRAAAGSKSAKRRRQILVRSRRQLGPRAAHEQSHAILVRVRVRIRIRRVRRIRRVLLHSCVGFIAARLEHCCESHGLLLRFVGVVTAPRVRRRRGVDVPGTLAVAGFGDFDMAGDSGLGLTTVRIPGYAIGAEAGRLLLARKRGEAAGPRILDLGFAIVRRATA